MGESSTSYCIAKIWHGPGHQSSTCCRLIGSHKIHETKFGSDNKLAYWTGIETYSGFFDEPPTIQDVTRDGKI